LEVTLRFNGVEKRKLAKLTRGMYQLGKVKTEQIKRVGKELMARFPEKFSNNFDENKLSSRIAHKRHYNQNKKPNCRVHNKHMRLGSN